jgi:hypothetical protein
MNQYDLKEGTVVKLKTVGSWEMVIVNIDFNAKQALCTWHGEQGQPYQCHYPIVCLIPVEPTIQGVH